MTKERTNIYKSGREHAKLTQECAAELIGIGRRRLSDYENEVTPPDDIVALMVEVYKYPQLAYQHLKHKNPVGNKYLPNVEHNNLSQSAIALYRELRHVKSYEEDILDIAYDNQITADEISTWEKAKVEILELAGACMAIALVI